MNMKGLFESTTPEQKTKAINCKSAEELFKLAKSEGMDMSAEDAAELFSALNGKTGEISDDDLDNVAGGKSDAKTCSKCGSKDTICITAPRTMPPYPPLRYKCNKCNEIFG